ncbi:MAG: DUF3224 domain-containing protein [Acidobacteriota bacterium]
MRKVVSPNKRRWTRAAFVVGVCLTIGGGVVGRSQTDQTTEAVMKTRASGSFEVNLAPLPLDAKAADAALGRMSIDKVFLGDLEATSKGEMLTAITGVKGSAGYVAIERVGGKLNGRSGTFVLQHTGTMTRGEQQLSVMVVPDSGTDQLTGLVGRMTIKIEGTKHLYDFEYTLPVK